MRLASVWIILKIKTDVEIACDVDWLTMSGDDIDDGGQSVKNVGLTACV